MENKNIYVNFSGVLADFHGYNPTREEIENGDFIKELRPFSENVTFIKNAVKNNNVFIISRVASENAKDKTIEWIKRYIPEIPAENIIIYVNVSRKTDMIKSIDDILIDDNERYTKQWNKKGGTSYLLTYKGEPIKM